jgi:lysozyme family protein
LDTREFVTYLEAKNDIETLYKIGEYNEYGYKERRRAPGGLIALRSKYKETKDIKYKEYADTVVEATWALIILHLGIFIGISIFLSSLYSLFSKT